MSNSELCKLVDNMVKSAQATKKADEAGPTAHPIGKEDDGTVAAVEGAFSKEKSQDVKADFKVQTVEDTGDLIGNDEPKGENVEKYDAEEETPNKKPKDSKDDPGTSTPYKTASDRMEAILTAIQSFKSAADESDAAPVEKKEEQPAPKTDELKPSDAADIKTAPTDAETKEAEAKAEALGRSVADSMLNSVDQDAEIIAGIQKKAAFDAQKFAEFLYGFNKSAEEELPPEVMEELMGMGGEEVPGEEVPGEEVPGEEVPGEEVPGEEIPEDEDAALQELAIALDAAGITPEELVEAAEAQIAEMGAGGGTEEEEEEEVIPDEEAPAEKMASVKLTKSASQLLNVLKASKTFLQKK
jgi:hypothetical protein